MNTARKHPVRSAFVRAALGLTAVSLLIYVPFRYVTRPPEFGGVLGSTYALLFPLSVVLALGALAVAWRPELLGGFAAGDRSAGRWVLGSYGAAWVLMGLMCVPTLTALAAHSPVEGLLSTIHMAAQHVFLGFGAVAVAVEPRVSRAILAGESARSARAAHAEERPAESRL